MTISWQFSGMNKDSYHSLLHVVSKIELNIEYSVDKHKNESRINYGGNKMTRITEGYFLYHSTTEKFIAIPLKFCVIVIICEKKSRWSWRLWMSL